MAAVLEVQNLRTEFRMRHSSVVAVDDISFSVGQGAAVAHDTSRDVNFAAGDPRSDGAAIPQGPDTK